MTLALCDIDDFDDPGSKGFELIQGDDPISIFVVHRSGEFFGFINSCPHTGAPLEWQEDQFLDRDGTFIQCSTHDALFEIDSGACIAGPCVGGHLRPVNISLRDGTLYLERD